MLTTHVAIENVSILIKIIIYSNANWRNEFDCRVKERERANE